jgi:hypothetical protein
MACERSMNKFFHLLAAVVLLSASSSTAADAAGAIWSDMPTQQQRIS